MSLRLQGAATVKPNSVAPGDEVAFEAKVENKAREPATLRLDVELAPRGGLGAPPSDLTVAFDAVEAVAKGKTRSRVRFVWRAALPEGVDALTYRGKLFLRDAATDAEVASAPLDVYVRRA